MYRQQLRLTGVQHSQMIEKV